MEKLIDETGNVIFEKLIVADTFFGRLKGLMFDESMGEDEAVLFKNVSSIHTFFMRFSIDVIFMDRSMKILDIRKNIKPWRLVSYSKAYYTLECLSGVTFKKNIAINKVCLVKKKEG